MTRNHKFRHVAFEDVRAMAVDPACVEVPLMRQVLGQWSGSKPKFTDEDMRRFDNEATRMRQLWRDQRAAGTLRLRPVKKRPSRSRHR